MKKGFVSIIFLLLTSFIFLRLYFKIDILEVLVNFFGKENLLNIWNFIKNIYIKIKNVG